MSSRSKSDPTFSVVVVAYNSRGTLPACLDSVERAFAGAPEDVEVIVVDNASRDGTAEWLKARPRVQAVLNAENLGFSRACNQGARPARGNHLVFLNPDACLTSGALEKMAAAFSDPRVGAVGPVSNYVAGLQRLDLNWPPEAGTLESIPGSSLMEKGETVARILSQAHAGAFRETKLLIGFCLMIPRALYEAVGGMDENLFLGNDDLDLSWRLRLRGHKLVVAAGAFVLHEGQISFQSEAKPAVDALVQESTDALFRKLSRHYGGDDQVPPPEELWGMNWFRPSPAAKRISDTSAQRENPMAPETQSPNRESPWTFVVVLPPEGDAEAARETLDTLPMRGMADVLVLNRTGVSAFTPPGGDQTRKLDLGASLPLGQTLALAAKLAKHPNLLVLAGGLHSSVSFNTWLERQPPGAEALCPEIRAQEDGSPLAGSKTLALICRRDWLETRAGECPETGDAAVTERLQRLASPAPAGAPPLTLRATAQIHATVQNHGGNPGDGLFLQYP
jgi:GT2 family glycosyltransferase